jgi:hypothetical protein
MRSNAALQKTAHSCLPTGLAKGPPLAYQLSLVFLGSGAIPGDDHHLPDYGAAPHKRVLGVVAECGGPGNLRAAGADGHHAGQHRVANACKQASHVAASAYRSGA